MQIYEMNTKDIKKLHYKDIMFFMLAEGGAMGEPGAVNIITKGINGYRYFTPITAMVISIWTSWQRYSPRSRHSTAAYSVVCLVLLLAGIMFTWVPEIICLYGTVFLSSSCHRSMANRNQKSIRAIWT